MLQKRKKDNQFKPGMYMVLLYAFTSIYATFPVIFRLRSFLYGGTADPYAWIWNFWWLKYSWTNNIPANFMPFIAYPFGLEFTSVSPVWAVFNKYFSIWMGEIAAYNLQVIGSFFLSGLAMYFLIIYFTKNRLASFFSGIVFMLCPYHFAQSWDHLGLSNMHWMIFYIIALFNYNNKRTYKNMFICGFSFALIGQFSNYYYVYFMMIFSVIFFIFNMTHTGFKAGKINSKEVFRFAKLSITWLTPVALIMLPQIWRYIQQAFSSSPELTTSGLIRPFSHLLADSASPLNYFLPAEYHPILGKITKIFIGTPLYGENNGGEQSLYLGIIPLFLAFIGYKEWRKNKREETSDSKTDSLMRFWIFVLFAFMICSFSPYWGNVNGFFIPFPSFFLYKIFPMFRNYARMGALVMASVCVLAGFGLKNILDAVKNQKKKILITGLLSCVVFFEFLNIPPFRITDASNFPEVYSWLKQQPKNIVIAEYPIEADERPYLFYQTIHEKSMINGAYKNTYAYEVRQKIIDANAEKTAGILRFLGAKYLVLHEDKYSNYEGGMVLGQIPDLKSNRGYVLVKDWGNEKIYEIVAKPVDPKTVIKNSNKTKRKSYNDGKLAESYFGFNPGDKFSYTIKYFDIIPILDIYVEVKNAPNRKNVLLEADVKAKGILVILLDVSIRMASLIVKDSTVPLEYNQSIKTGNDTREKNVIFNRDQMIMEVKDRKVSINKYTQDPLSAIFHISTFDFAKKKKFEIFINPGKTNYKLKAEVVGKTQIKSLGEKIDCWELTGEYISLKGKPKKIASFNIWFNDSKAKPLVRMEVLTKAGFVTLERK